VEYLYKTLVDTQASVDYLYQKSKLHKTKVKYPKGAFGKDLKQIAELMTADTDIKIYYANLGGFDTHVGQKNKQTRLLKTYSDAMSIFVKDLKNNGLLDDTLIMTFSEFGRKAKENGSLGTDHGEIAPMFVFGNPVNGGVSGTNVDLSEATDDNNFQLETVQFDYRQTLGTLLQNFLGADDTVIDSAFFNFSTDQSFANLKINELIKDSFSVDEECYGQTLEIDKFNAQGALKEWIVFPNPVREILQVHSEKEFATVSYRVFNNQSQTVLNGTHQLINGTLKVNTQNLTPGIYFIQIISNGKNETHKVLKL
jgi:hypothetical protein